MKRTSLSQLSDGLQTLQLPENHVYIVHSSMLMFGLVEGGLPGVFSCLKDVLGPNATILMPAFTFSFDRTRTWDYSTSKAETGALTEYFRKLPGTRRTIHPFHSLSVAGPLAQTFVNCTNLSSFGPGSPFELLYDMQAVNIALGTEFVGGATFLHHAEETAQVPYRYYKNFPGNVFDENGEMLTSTFKMFVREVTETYQYINQWGHVWDEFVSNGLVMSGKINSANLFTMDIKNTHDYLCKKLNENPFYCSFKKDM